MAKFSTNSKMDGLSKGSICSASVDLIQNTEHVITSYIALSPNVILFITALAGNVLILLALWRTSSLHSPSKLLLRCLATTDVSVGLISQPLFVIHVASVINKRWKICFISELSVYISSAALCGISVLTLTAISVDRLLALQLKIRYRELVTVQRVWIVIIIIWIVSFANAFLYLWNPFICLSGCCIEIVVAVSITTLSYSKIYFKLRYQMLQVRDRFDTCNQGSSGMFNIEKYKKTVYSALWVHLALVVCNGPFVIVKVVEAIRGRSPTLFVAGAFTTTLVYLNSSLNPVLYCWKIKEVRVAVKDTVISLCRRLAPADKS